MLFIYGSKLKMIFLFWSFQKYWFWLTWTEDELPLVDLLLLLLLFEAGDIIESLLFDVRWSFGEIRDSSFASFASNFAGVEFFDLAMAFRALWTLGANEHNNIIQFLRRSNQIYLIMPADSLIHKFDYFRLI